MKAQIKNFLIRGGIVVLATVLLSQLLPSSAKAASILKPANNLGLVGYWSLDEGTSTVVHDFSGKGSTGSTTNPVWVNGKRGKAMSFNGAGSYVDMGIKEPLNLSTTGTISAWFKVAPADTSKDGYIAGNSDAFNDLNGYTLLFCGQSCGAGIIYFETNGSGFRLLTSPGGYGDGQWHLVVGTWDGSNDRLYIDGVLVAGPAGQVTPISNVYPFEIGRGPSGPTAILNGSVDDVRVYNRALSINEINSLYKVNGGAKLNMTNAPKGTLLDGLVGWWTMDGKDTSWTSPTAATTRDLSGNSNTGTLNNMRQGIAPAQGKINQAFKFDGFDDSISLSNASLFHVTTPWSMSAWVNLSTLNAGDIIVAWGQTSNNGPHISYNGGGKWRVGVWGGVSCDGGTVVTNKWTQITGTFDGSNTRLYQDGVLVAGPCAVTPASSASPTAFIGSDLGGSSLIFTGSIDDVRIYNRTLSAAEVVQLYGVSVGTVGGTEVGSGSLSTNLLGYWSFNNKDLSWTSNTAFDRSGQTGHDGVMTNMSTTTSPVIGKLGQGLDFDGLNDYVNTSNFADNLPNFTVSTWFKALPGAAQPACGGQIVSKLASGGASAGAGWTLALGGGSCGVAANRLYGFIQTSGGSNWVTKYSNVTFNDGRWHHAVMVVTGANTVTLYIDGSSANTTSYTGGSMGSYTSISSVRIGDDVDNEYFKGSIDEVRVYNRDFSASEVQQLYNSGR